METLAPLLGGGLSAILIARRGWWFLCVAAGWYQAAQLGQLIDDKEAFSRGRTHVIQTVLLAVTGAFSRIDWPAIGGGLQQARRDFRAHLAITWRGIKRDCRRFWAFVTRQRWTYDAERSQTLKLLRESKKLIGKDDGEAALAYAANMRGLFLQGQKLSERIERGEYITKPDLNEHAFIRQQLRQNAKMGLLPLPVPALPFLPWLIAGGVALVGLLGLQTWRVDRLKADNVNLTRLSAGLTVANKLGAEALARRDDRIQTMAQQCLVEIDTANQSLLKAQQAAAAERKRRLDLQKTTLGGGGDVPLGDILRQLPGGGASPAGPAADSDTR